MQTKVATCYLFCSYMLGLVLLGFTNFKFFIVLFQLQTSLSDGTTNNILKYEKAVILFNFSSIFLEPQVSHFNSKNSETLQVYH